MDYVISPQPYPAIPVQGKKGAFPVHRIYCVGRNYGDHVKEMGGDPKQEPPVFFSKPASAIVTNNRNIPYPQATDDLHHEVEMVVALSSGGMNISQQDAMDCVYGYAVGVDFTRRDLQAVAKDKGRPWDVAKGFDDSAPVSAIKPLADCSLSADAPISLQVNGELRQSAALSEMIWGIAEIISSLSSFYELKAGDLIYTGTPAGVAAVTSGDRLQASLEGVAEMDFEII
jgi:fumarylpyruvate hydrolase